MAASTVEIMNRGMKCLTDQMGIVEAEQFISCCIVLENEKWKQWGSNP